MGHSVDTYPPIAFIEGGVMEAATTEYEVTQTDKGGRTATHTARLSDADVALYRSLGHAVSPVVSTKQRPAPKNKTRSRATK